MMGVTVTDAYMNKKCDRNSVPNMEQMFPQPDNGVYDMCSTECLTIDCFTL
jgi:hypothetical protein